MIHNPVNSIIIKFLREVGIECIYEEGATGFIKRVEIRRGELFIDPQCWSGDILHEAGHIAITPSRWRYLLSGDVKYGLRKMMKELQALNLHPDHPLERAMVQNSDPEVTAWSWAVGKHLSLEPEQVIDHTRKPTHYAGEGPEIALMLRERSYVGIHGLSHAGFCCTRIAFGGKPVYPKLAYWLQI